MRKHQLITFAILTFANCSIALGQSPASKEPAPVHCTSDAHCSTGQYCGYSPSDFSRKRCLRKSPLITKGDTCGSNGDCPSGQKCDRRSTNEPWRCVKAR